MKIIYLGPAGTYTESAARELFVDSELIPMQPIANVIKAVDRGKADFAVVPLENFYNGEVRETLDALTLSKSARIVQEKAIKIVHCLGALPNHGEIRKILSKDQAIEQCSRYLCENYPDAATIATSSTSEAVSVIVKENMLDAAAIASENTIRDSNLLILDRNLCPNNKTRFAIVGTEKAEPTGDDKTFLAIHPPIRDKPGVLSNSLGFIAGFGINLESIQSRPDGKKGYYFYIELNGHESDEKVRRAIEAIRFSLDLEGKSEDTVKILGSYKNTNWKDEN